MMTVGCQDHQTSLPREDVDSPMPTAPERPESMGENSKEPNPETYDTYNPKQLRMMTLNVQWLLGSAEEAERLIEKGIYGLEAKANEEVIQAQHDELAHFIARNEPDVVCLQEVINQEAIDRLVRTLEINESYYEAFFVDSGPRYLEQDVVFLTKRLPDKTSNERARRPEGVSKVALLELEFGGEKFAFLGLHFLSRTRDPSRLVRRETQAREITPILRDLRDDGAITIVMGDFNDWDRETPDSDLNSNPITMVFEIIKDYDVGVIGQELFNAAEHIEHIEDRFTVDYDGRRTMLDHILLPVSQRERLQNVRIDHSLTPSVFDHDPVIVDLLVE